MKYVINTLIVVCSVFIALEIVVRITGWDMTLIKPLLYYQGADLEVHRVSDNDEKLYELLPNAVHQYGNNKFTINSLGFRDRERKINKDKDVFRIICFGGSNTYGAAVSDNQTYPYYLEQLLNKDSKRKYEVWNVGCCAYSQTQDVETAKMVVREYNPDLLIFQKTNDIRRAFLRNTDYAHFLRKNPSLYWENIRFLPGYNSRLGRWVFIHSYGYRTLILLINRIKSIHGNNPLFMCEEYPHIGNCENELRFGEFYRKISARIPVLAWTLRDNAGMTWGTDSVETLDVFQPSNYPANVSKEYFAIHPPAYVYQWYAKTMAKELKKKQLI